MQMIEIAIEHLPRFSTVLLACGSPSYANAVIEALDDRDIGVLGPAYTFSQALTYAAQSAADLAIVQPPEDAPERGEALARELERTWGIPSVVVEAAQGSRVVGR